MGKKGSIILIIVLFSGLAALVFFIQRGSRNITTDPFQAIPDDAGFLIESVDLPGLLNSFTEGNGFFNQLKTVKELDIFCRNSVMMRDLLSRNEIAGLFEKNRTVISFHYTSRRKLLPLLIMNAPPRTGFGALRDIIKDAAGSKPAEKRSGTSRLLMVPLKKSAGFDTLFVTFRSGLIMCSPSLGLLERSLDQSERITGISDTPGFSRIMGAAGRKEDKIYIVFRNFKKIVKSLTEEKSPYVADIFGKLAGSAEGDIYIDENGYIFSGYAESTDTSEILYKYKSRIAGELNTIEILPSSVILFETMAFQKNTGSAFGKTYPDNPAYSIASGLLPFTGDEITRAVVDLKEDSAGIHTLTIFELSNRDMAEQLVTGRIKEWISAGNLNEKDYVKYFQPDDQTKIPVYITPFKGIASVYIPEFGKGYGDSLIAFIGNYMITGDSYTALRRILYDNILNKTLSNDINYRDFENTLPSRAGYYFYCVPSAIVDYLSQWLDKDIIEGLLKNISSLRKIQAAGFRLVASNGMIYNTLSVKFGEGIKEESGAEWETLLDTAASIKPFFFTNHNSGAKEIFIQDLRNNAYLINAAGRVLWKIPLGERILGNVFMIDYYQNGKYQLLFAGRTQLHLIDRNGNYVERYPVRLRSPASAPPALFDYDGNMEYRILIPGEDRNIYAYDKSGNIVKGWKLFRTNNVVKTAVRFFRVSGKDYLVVADNSTVYFLDRSGSTRLKPKEPVIKAAGSEIRLNPTQGNSVVFSSPEGMVQFIAFDGTVTKIDLGIFSVDHTFDFFDIDGDGFGEYVFIDRGILYLYDNDKTEVFRKDFETDRIEGPISFIFSASDKQLGVFDINRKLIYLIGRKGNVMTGFPLRGASVFSIGKLSENSGFNLIVVGENNFLYNYRLDTESGNNMK